MIVVYRYDIQYIIVVYHNYYTHQNRWDPSGFFSHLLGPLLFVSCSAQWWGSWANHHPNHLQSRAAALAPPSSTAPGKKKSRFVNKKTCVNTKISFIFYIIEVWQYNNWCKHVQTSGIDAHMQRTVCTNVTARPYGLPRRLERCSNNILRHAQIPAGLRFGISRTTNPKPWKLRILSTRKNTRRFFAAISACSTTSTESTLHFRFKALSILVCLCLAKRTSA